MKPAENQISKPSPAASSSSSPQKSPMISLGSISKQPPEPKIELPAYYNPNVINVNKFAEQQKKRKLLWSGKKDEPAKDAAKWGGAKFSQDSDGTKATKFMRLMGIKDGERIDDHDKLLQFSFSNSFQLRNLKQQQLQSQPMNCSQPWSSNTKWHVKSLTSLAVLASASVTGLSNQRMYGIQRIQIFLCAFAEKWPSESSL